MDTVKEIEATFSHGITLAERKNIVVTGVKKIESFDSDELVANGHLKRKEENTESEEKTEKVEKVEKPKTEKTTKKESKEKGEK